MVTDFAAALANPIAYQSALEKHAQQLAVLEEEAEEDRQYGAGEVCYTLHTVTSHCNSMAEDRQYGAGGMLHVTRYTL